MLLFLLISCGMVANALGSCDVKWHSYDGKCLYFSGLSKTFQGSVDFCLTATATMAVIDSAEKSQFIDGLLGSNSNKDLWIPLKEKDTLMTFLDLDGNEWTGDYQENFVNTPGFLKESDRTNGEFTCVYRRKTGDSSYDWLNGVCTQEKLHVCEKDAPSAVPVCDPGWTMNAEGDYCVKVIKKKKKNYDGAQSYCREMDGDLATSITSRKERSLVMGQIKSSGHFWIGVHFSDQEGAFVYADNKPLGDKTPFKKGNQNPPPKTNVFQ